MWDIETHLCEWKKLDGWNPIFSNSELKRMVWTWNIDADFNEINDFNVEEDLINKQSNWWLVISIPKTWEFTLQEYNKYLQKIYQELYVLWHVGNSILPKKILFFKR